jgi:hypothetical protein
MAGYVPGRSVEELIVVRSGDPRIYYPSLVIEKKSGQYRDCLLNIWQHFDDTAATKLLFGRICSKITTTPKPLHQEKIR